MAITITSAAFDDGKPIPKKYTCDGKDLSPPLAFSGLPGGTASVALICDDPDAPGGTFTHWVLFDLPPDTAGLEEGMAAATLPGKAAHGVNSFGKATYGGPCPPGGTHRYYFTLYALDRELGLDEGVDKDAVLHAMQGHVLDKGEFMGTYAR
ncbi:YbhB/YbcL family Raf kinase inhibitor-like protein [Desulfohalovibrio reitneri]|uniref:YbhB/YbcL family Raf kinase inhibitor-like protein n=1 Tax=Desulfohalovibrio reitneri TaxID=1307759 RepID=UPI0004A6BD95|nr:YbhB/YbcL family Raf kinase inhibitor-like protein [Desulfohalovibrio reitneri]